MKVFSIMLFKYSEKRDVDPVRLAEALELGEFSFFKRSSVKEVLTFVSRKVVNRSSSTERSSVAHEGYVAHVVVLPNKLACVFVTDKDYPNRVAFDIIRDALAAFQKDVKPEQWASAAADLNISVAALAQLLQKAAKPTEVDKILKLQQDVDEVKSIMVKNIDTMLERNEALEDLVAKSDDLSVQSKTFMRQSKKLNSCC